MTFTPNPPPNYSLLPLENHKNHKNRRNSKYNRQKNSWDYSSSKVTLLVANRSDATAGGVKSAGNANGRAAYLSTLGLSLDCMKSRIVPVISDRRRTWFATGMSFGMERVAPKKHIHSPAADEALWCLFKEGKNDDAINYVLTSYESELWEEDYIYMLKKLCNTGNFLLAKICFDFIIWKQKGRVAKCKLTNIMIDALGKLGEVNLALSLFETARLEGYGNTVDSFSTMISVYGQNGRFSDAIDLFRSMSSSGLEPDMITYNSLIGVGFIGEMNFDKAFDKCKEMERSGTKTDDVTYNVLLSGYGRHDMYDEVRRLFEEMKVRNICPIKLTYFTMIVIEGIRRNVWKGEWSISCFDLHVMCCVMVHAWLLNMHSTLFEGTELPEIVSIITGSGKHSKVMGDGSLKSNGTGRFVSPGDLVATWLRQPDILNLLVLCDVLNHSQAADPSHNYPALGN